MRRGAGSFTVAASGLLPVLMPALATLGCAPEEPDTPRFSVVRQAIADGYVDEDDTAVMGILQPGGGVLCSGALIAPNVVLTAGHCVAPTSGDEGGVVCGQTTLGNSAPPQAFFVGSATEITIANAGEFYVQEVVRVPGDGNAFCGNDVAMLILKELVPEATAAPLQPRVEAPLQVAEVYSAIGYGGTDNNGTGSGTRRRRDDLEVLCVGDGCGSSQVELQEWIGGGGVCRGDSGGPAVDAEGRVAGVASRGSLSCDQSLYVDTYAWGDWLKDTVVYASGVGVYEAPAWTAGSSVNPEHSMPMGDACSSDDDCPSGRCLDDGASAAPYCSRLCDEAHGCPEDYTCESQGGLQLCTAVPLPPPFKRAPEGDCSVAEVGRDMPADGGGRWHWHWHWHWAALAALGLLVRRRRRRRR